MLEELVFGDCSVEALLLGFACGIGDFDTCDETVRAGVLGDGGAVGVSAFPPTGGWPVSVLEASP